MVQHLLIHKPSIYVIFSSPRYIKYPYFPNEELRPGELVQATQFLSPHPGPNADPTPASFRNDGSFPFRPHFNRWLCLLPRRRAGAEGLPSESPLASSLPRPRTHSHRLPSRVSGPPPLRAGPSPGTAPPAAPGPGCLSTVISSPLSLSFPLSRLSFCQHG